MKGLLIKDFYTSLAYFKLYLICLALMTVCGIGSGNLFMLFFFKILFISLPSNIIAFEDKEKWTVFAHSLPLKRSVFVSEKFLLTLILFGLTCIYDVVVALIYGLIHSDMSIFGQCAASVPITVLLTSILSLGYILIFKYGSEKGRMVYMLFGGIIGAVCAVFASLSVNDTAVDFLTRNVSIPLVAAGICAVSAALFAFAWGMSVRVYRKREVG